MGCTGNSALDLGSYSMTREVKVSSEGRDRSWTVGLPFTPCTTRQQTVFTTRYHLRAQTLGSSCAVYNAVGPLFQYCEHRQINTAATLLSAPLLEQTSNEVQPGRSSSTQPSTSCLKDSADPAAHLPSMNDTLPLSRAHVSGPSLLSINTRLLCRPFPTRAASRGRVQT